MCNVQWLVRLHIAHCSLQYEFGFILQDRATLGSVGPALSRSTNRASCGLKSALRRPSRQGQHHCFRADLEGDALAIDCLDLSIGDDVADENCSGIDHSGGTGGAIEDSLQFECGLAMGGSGRRIWSGCGGALRPAGTWPRGCGRVIECELAIGLGLMLRVFSGF